jgi:hypothetical protein
MATVSWVVSPVCVLTLFTMFAAMVWALATR